jgi:hypothetical protein
MSNLTDEARNPRRPKGLSHRWHRRLIGILGLLLPFLLYGMAGLRPTNDVPPWDLLTSVSAYYHTGAVGVFVGVLFALSLFLVTYQGYEGEVADRVVGLVGGLAAIGVALFPTTAPSGFVAPSWCKDWLSHVHSVSAIVLFGSFIVFSVWLFRRSRGAKTAEKRRRNAIYLICGMAMIVGVLWAIAARLSGSSIFWPEALAIGAFAVSWLVKGEVVPPLMRTMGLLEREGAAEPADVTQRGG